MSNLILHREMSQAIALPEPRGGAISIRPAVQADVKFIDELQRKHAKMVGWFPTKQIEGNIAKGRILIAEEINEPRPLGSGNACVDPATQPLPYGRGSSPGTPVGYCISNDRYHKHDDCGIVYQLNVMPTKQRGLIGASLIKAVFDRAAYGCKLFCCWCAQDLQANHFWESLGFVPLAFRTGSRIAGSKRTPRIHIFWQRRIREGDIETPYWFPSETTGGAMREARIVLPIPPGTHWSDAKPAVLPGISPLLVGEGSGVRAGLEATCDGAHPHPSPLPPPAGEGVRKQRQKKPKAPKVPSRPKRGLWFAPPEAPAPPEPTPEEKKAAKAKERAERPRMKNDPKLVAAARELRDRYTEQINAAPGMLLPPSACGKYDVSRQLAPGAAPSAMKQTPLLKAA